jgi:hypothetical protein
MTFDIPDAAQPFDAGHSTSKSGHCKAKIAGIAAGSVSEWCREGPTGARTSAMSRLSDRNWKSHCLNPWLYRGW